MPDIRLMVLIEEKRLKSCGGPGAPLVERSPIVQRIGLTPRFTNLDYYN
jgi:hypothetical protein